MMNTTYFRRNLFILCLGCFLLVGCEEETSTSQEPDVVTDQTPTEGILETKPDNYPLGYGVDFETDSIVSLDQYPTFQYDLKMLAYRIKDTLTGVYGGRPVVFLWGDVSTAQPAKALNVSAFAGYGLGLDGFNEFQYVTKAMRDSLKADGVFPIDPNDESLYPWSDGFMLMSEELLLSAYSALVIGDKVVRLEEAQSPVWLIKTSDGNYVKWQHIERQGGGHVPIRWYQFKSNEIKN